MAKEAATGFTNLFQAPGQTWDDAIADLATAFHSGVSQSSAQLIKTIEGFSLDRHRPKIIPAPAFKVAKIDLNRLISETINGDQYLSAIRKKTIPSIQTRLYNAENMTWNNFFTTLQQLYNARLKDQAYSFDKPSYHDQPLTNLPPEKATFPVQTRRGGQPSRGQYAPQPMRAPPARSNPRSTTYVPGNNSSPAPRNRSRPQQRQSPANDSDNRPNMNAPEAVSFRYRCSPQLEKDLGLIAQDVSPDFIASIMCWYCGRPGHKQSDCFIKGFLDCYDLLMYHTPQGYQVTPRSVPMTTDQKTRQRATWWAFMQGRNDLGKRFTMWEDIEQLLRDYRQPSLAEGREMLADVKRSRENIRERMRQFAAGNRPYAPAYSPPRREDLSLIDSPGVKQWDTQRLRTS